MQPRPKRLDGLKLLGAHQNGKLVFLDPTIPNWAQLTPAAAMLLSMCDGLHSVEDLTLFYRSAGCPSENNASEPEQLIQMFEEQGLLEGSIENAPAKIETHPLLAIWANITKACNLRCSYCYFSAGERMTEEMSTEKWLGIIDELAAGGGASVRFIGGEPLLHPDLFRLARRAKDRGMAANLYTNGTLITKSNAKKIAGLFDFVQVSMDGLEREHDFTRGQGSFSRTERGLTYLLERDVVHAVSCTLSEINYPIMDQFMEYLAGLGVKSLHVPNLMRSGRGMKFKTERIPYKKHAELLVHLWNKWGDIIEIAQMRLLFPGKKFKRVSCNPGNGWLDICPDGNVYACHRFMGRGDPSGSVLYQGLTSIYESSEALKEIRNRSVDNRVVCAECDFRYLCGGGCLATQPPEDAKDCELAEGFMWKLTKLDQEPFLEDPNVPWSC